MNHKPQNVRIEDGVFLGFVLIVSIAFALVIEPFFAAILWGVIAAILFTPLNHNLLYRMPGRPNTAAGLTLLIIVAVVILPAIVLTIALVQEATLFYGRIQSGEINIARVFAQFQARLPDWASAFLARLGVTNFAAVREMLSEGIASSFRTVATQLFQVGQSAFSFFVALSVTLYLTFFLLRDGPSLAARLDRAAPLRTSHRRALMQQFVVVTRATIKGSIVVAVVQGLIGGVVFWALGIPGPLLWGVLMGCFSLIPAVGTGLVWVPVALYLLATGAIAKGVILVFCGLFVIGLVDNLLRPILVGRDTRIPDYVVLITTLGGIDMFGFNGIVIGPVIAALFIATWNIVTRMRTGDGIEGPLTKEEAR
ncbi:Membrane protein [Sphingomonas paucimobilis]|uniref:AI-2E family transporter n=1 Tax=Sphingobium sp. DC-2 TaxID=1303256 RepID=UPI000445ABE5|nr:AI-2E family transporter [Sphingobium sp. DC-2]EZP73441.1 Membrane protein [Sphingomonas paucimobilis]